MDGWMGGEIDVGGWEGRWVVDAWVGEWISGWVGR